MDITQWRISAGPDRGAVSR
jgi:quercetin dioxygenase-like cupin family protein